MKETPAIDLRLLKIIALLDRFAAGDFQLREAFNEKGDEIDSIIRRLNALGEKIHASRKIIHDYETRVSAIMNVLLKYTFFDFSEKAEISGAGDEIDAIALALNTLGEELNERIIAERKYTDELEKLAVVIETTADAVISMSPEGVITHWNKSAERIFGYTASEMLGRNPWALTPGELRDEMSEVMQRVLSGEQVIDYPSKRKRKDGQIIDVAITLTPIKEQSGRVVSVSGVARDITEAKKAEQVLRESEERYRSLVEGVKDYAIMNLDQNGIISSWNEGVKTIFGFEQSDLIGQHFSVLCTADDKRGGLPERMVNEALQQGKSVVEAWKLRKDGSTFWANVVLTALRGHSGSVIGFSEITRDLTEAKKKDEEIANYTKTLELKNIELEKINKELASFAYISSHDLQEPLRKIQTLSSRVFQTDYKNLSEVGKSCFHRMENSANRMQQLIRDIIDYSTLSTSENKCENCDLNAILDEVVAGFNDEIIRKEAAVQAGKLCVASVIPHQFRQLMKNLIGNALKFSNPDRKPVIRVRSEITTHCPFQVRNPRNVKRYCHLSVSDNGIGFEPQYNEQVFEVFQRLHNQEVYPGTGIGLAICKKIIDNHNGFIKAEGRLGKGTTIDMYIPYE